MRKLLVFCLFALAAGGCGSIYPQSQPAHPAAVYVADYGIHSSLLMPTGHGQYVEYAFGDWGYAALNHCWPPDALGAMLISFQSGLGRRFINVSPEHPIPQPIHPSPNRLMVVYASQEKVARVVKELDDRYQAQDSMAVYNPYNMMYYVKDSQHYSVLNNCNHLTAHCLREMGCDVKGIVVLSHFWVAPQKAETVPPPIVTVRAAPPPPRAAATMPSASLSR